MIEYLFLDLDDTILDFKQAERVAIHRTLADFGVEPTAEVVARYRYHSTDCWHRLELGELDREQVKVVRFRRLFQELGRQVDAEAVSRAYVENLAIGHWFLPGAEEAVDRLSKKYRLFLASNGTASVQKGRMTSANLYRFFEQVFVSEEIGHNKPSKAYFDACFARIPGFDPARALMVGDSLTSDIRGGNNAGLRTCWVNPDHKSHGPEYHVDYEIEGIHQLEALLEEL